MSKSSLTPAKAATWPNLPKEGVGYILAIGGLIYAFGWWIRVSIYDSAHVGLLEPSHAVAVVTGFFFVATLLGGHLFYWLLPSGQTDWWMRWLVYIGRVLMAMLMRFIQVAGALAMNCQSFQEFANKLNFTDQFFSLRYLVILFAAFDVLVHIGWSMRRHRMKAATLYFFAFITLIPAAHYYGLTLSFRAGPMFGGPINRVVEVKLRNGNTLIARLIDEDTNTLLVSQADDPRPDIDGIWLYDRCISVRKSEIAAVYESREGSGVGLSPGFWKSTPGTTTPEKPAPALNAAP